MATAASHRRATLTVGATPTRVDLARLLPADRNITPAARNLLHRLHQYRGTYTLSAQEQGDRGEDMDALLVQHNGGVRPAIRGYDNYIGGLTAGNATTFLSWIMDDWDDARVIPTISQHWTPALTTEVAPGDPALDDPVSIPNLLTAGTTENTRYNTWKQNLGDDLATLQAAGVPVLFRPWHEASGSWFWWGQGGGGSYRKLWLDLFEYLTVTRGIHNLLWVWSAGSTTTFTTWYPGPEYVDIIGVDIYGASTPDYTATAGALAVHDAPRKIRAMTEVGWIPGDAQAFAAIPCGYVMTWTGSYLTQNSDAALTAFYADPATVTRDNVGQFLDGTLP